MSCLDVLHSRRINSVKSMTALTKTLVPTNDRFSLCSMTSRGTQALTTNGRFRDL